MIAFLQRVTQAAVVVGDSTVGGIGDGLMVLLCAERDDQESDADQLLQKLVNFRVFSDAAGKMNLSLLQLAQNGLRPGLLLVPQFTLAADTRSGNRPSFTPAAPPALGKHLFDYFKGRAQALHGQVLALESGVFGADMKVSLINDGPVSFWLQTRKSATS